MCKYNLIVGVLTLVCSIILLPSLGTAQIDKVKTSMDALQAETGKLGAPEGPRQRSLLRRHQSLL